jgi:hypothetical protein
MSWDEFAKEHGESIQRISTIVILMILLWRLFEWLK